MKSTFKDSKQLPDWGTPESTKRAKEMTPGQTERKEQYEASRMDVEKIKEALKKIYAKEEKVECPKCEGEGCSHCDNKGYHMKEALDPVGKADADIDNDGDVDSSDRYLKKRRKAIKKAMAKEGIAEAVSTKPKRKTNSANMPFRKKDWKTKTGKDFAKFIKKNDKMRTEDTLDERAKWRKGYEASGHPAGYKHKDGKVGPLGGTYRYDYHYGEPVQYPVQRHKDIEDPLKGRKKAGVSTKGKKLLPRNKYANLKYLIKTHKGKHKLAGKLPEAYSNAKYLAPGAPGTKQHSNNKKRGPDNRAPVKRDLARMKANLSSYEKKLLQKMASNPKNAKRELEIAINTFKKAMEKSTGAQQSVIGPQLAKFEKIFSQINSKQKKRMLQYEESDWVNLFTNEELYEVKKNLEKNRVVVTKGSDVLNLLTGEVISLKSKDIMSDLIYDKGLTFKTTNDIKNLSQVDGAVKKAITTGGWKVKKVSSLDLAESANVELHEVDGGARLRAKLAARKEINLRKKERAAKRKQKAKTSPAKKKSTSVPKNKGVRTGAPGETQIIMQLRSAQDLKGNQEIRFNKDSGKLKPDEIDAILRYHSSLKPAEKIKFRKLLDSVNSAKRVAKIVGKRKK